VVGEKGRVIAFEPTSWAFLKLKRNVELNSFNNIILEKLALSDVNRKDTVSFPSSWTLDKGGLPDYIAVEQVDLITLDDYVNTNKIGKIDLVKIDVDGYEYKVLRGGYNSIKRFKPAIIIELGRLTLRKHGDNLEDLVDLLISLDYSFYSENDLKVYRNRDEILKAVPDNDEIINVICRTKNKTSL
jgi:FkbM family methyltransferase